MRVFYKFKRLEERLRMKTRDIEDIKKVQTELQKIKTTIFEIKYTAD